MRTNRIGELKSVIADFRLSSGTYITACCFSALRTVGGYSVFLFLSLASNALTLWNLIDVRYTAKNLRNIFVFQSSNAMFEIMK